MPYKPLVSKIRVHNPNKKGTSIANRNYLTYIATREGVALDGVNNIDDLLNYDGMMEKDIKEEIIHQEANNTDYVRYMAKRPRSQGLFGNINTDDLAKVAQQVSDISNSGRIVYRGIISLSQKDGDALGFRNTDAWYNYLKKVMPDIAEKLGVSPTDHTWVAAFHAEETHPHVHYELWDNKDKIKSPYIHTSVQKSIRSMLSDEMFDNEYEQAIKLVHKEELEELKGIRNIERKNILEESMKVFDDMGYAPGVEYERLPDKIKDSELREIVRETNKLISMLPEHGRLTYKFLPPEAKEQLNKINDIIMKRPDVTRSVHKYISAVAKMHSYYGETKTDIKYAEKKAYEDIKKRIDNKILKEIKDVLSISNNEKIKDESKIKFEQDYFVKWNEEYKEAMRLVSANPSQAFNMIEDMAIKGNAVAINQAAKLLEKDIIPDMDISEAFEYKQETLYAYQNIYENNNDEYIKNYAMYQLGSIYLDETVEFYDPEKGIQYLEHSAAQGNQFAEYKVGSLYMDEEAAYYNPEKGIQYLEHSAAQENEYAQYRLGKILYYGEHTEKNEELGRYWLNKAASQGNQAAQNILDEKIKVQKSGDININFSYCLVKGVLQSVEQGTREVQAKNHNLAQQTSKQALRERSKNKDQKQHKFLQEEHEDEM